MKRRKFLGLLGGTAAAWPLGVRASKPRRYRGSAGLFLVGALEVLRTFFHTTTAFARVLMPSAMSRHNIKLVPRSAEGVPERLSSLIDELVREDVSVIVSPGPAIRVVQEKIKSIPVIFAFSGDPVAAGFVDTLSHGKEKITGLSYMAVELNGKRLDLMKELVPTVSRVTLLTNPIHPGEHLEVEESQRVATALGISLRYLQVRTPAEFYMVFRAMSESKTQGIVAVPPNLIMLERARLAEFAKDKSIPVISGWSEFARSGGLMTYGPNSSKFFHRLAAYVDKIVAGAKPNEIPIEQPIHRAGGQPQDSEIDWPHRAAVRARPR